MRHKDMPCTLGYRFYLREGRLHVHTTMRSQDLWLGFCYALFAATVLQELLAGWLGVGVGSITITSTRCTCISPGFRWRHGSRASSTRARRCGRCRWHGTTSTSSI
jgi:hypothetical protein